MQNEINRTIKHVNDDWILSASFIFLLFKNLVQCIINLSYLSRKKSQNTYKKERFAMVNLITGPKGTGKTQQMIELANEKDK